jgi:hypothetical protein
LVISVGGAAVIAAVVWFMSNRQHPENADRHADDRPNVDEIGRGNRSPGIIDRPAGPDAESMAPDPDPRPSRPGSARPGSGRIEGRDVGED